MRSHKFHSWTAYQQLLHRITEANHFPLELDKLDPQHARFLAEIEAFLFSRGSRTAANHTIPSPIATGYTYPGDTPAKTES